MTNDEGYWQSSYHGKLFQFIRESKDAWNLAELLEAAE